MRLGLQKRAIAVRGCRGLSKAVYYNTHDYMRKVATGVFVGKAYRLTEDIHACFSLTLPPPSPQA